MTDETDNGKLAAALERLANQSGEREAALRGLVERLTPRDQRSQKQHDAALVVEALKRDTGIDISRDTGIDISRDTEQA